MPKPTLRAESTLVKREVERDSGSGSRCAGTERSISESEMGGRALMGVTGVGEIIAMFVVVTSSSATGGVMSSELSS